MRTPRMRDVVLEQVRITGLTLRPAALVLALVFGIVTIPIVVDIARGTAGTWFDSREWRVIGIASFLCPFAVWRREKRFAPAFLWTLPVDRRSLALARVFGGWVWLMTSIAAFMIWQHTLAAISGVAGAKTAPLIAFAGATVFYVFGSALLLGLRHPLRWLLGTSGVFFVLAMLNEAIGRTESGQSRMFTSVGALRWAVYGPYGIDTLLGSRPLQSALEAASTGAIPTFLWLGAGLLALWAAASRHGERRRH